MFCKESFTSEMDLQCHLATHNKPFKCSMCDDSFLVEFLLDKHLQNVHSSANTSGAPNSTASPGSATSSLDNSNSGLYTYYNYHTSLLVCSVNNTLHQIIISFISKASFCGTWANSAGPNQMS